MFTLPMNYNVLEESEHILTENNKVVMELADADNILIIDTCTWTNYILKDKKFFQKLIEYIKIKFSGKIVVMFTDSLIIEICKRTGNSLQRVDKEMMEELSASFSVVVFKEENVGKWRMEMVDDDIQTINQNFKDIINAYRPQLPTIDRYLDTMTGENHDIIFENASVPKEDNFICKIIAHIKSQKKAKDSLAEQLVMLLVACVMDLYESDNQEMHPFYFLTDDRHASARIKDIQKHSDLFTDTFKFLTLPYLAKDMFELEILSSEEEVREYLEEMSARNPMDVNVSREGSLEVVSMKDILAKDLASKIVNDKKMNIIY